jgi:hypothetical protein
LVNDSRSLRRAIEDTPEMELSEEEKAAFEVLCTITKQDIDPLAFWGCCNNPP